MSNAQRQYAARPNPPVDFIWKDDEETGDVTIVDFRNGTAPEVVIPNEIGRAYSACCWTWRTASRRDGAICASRMQKS